MGLGGSLNRTVGVTADTVCRGTICCVAGGRGAFVDVFVGHGETVPVGSFCTLGESFALLEGICRATRGRLGSVLPEISVRAIGVLLTEFWAALHAEVLNEPCVGFPADVLVELWAAFTAIALRKFWWFPTGALAECWEPSAEAALADFWAFTPGTLTAF